MVKITGLGSDTAIDDADLLAFEDISQGTTENIRKDNFEASLALNSSQITTNVAFRLTDVATSQTTGNSTFAQVTFDTEEYDYGSNASSSSFTAPYDGIYHFDGRFHVSGSNTRVLCALFVDGVETVRGVDHAGTGQTSGTGVVVSADLKLTAGDVVTFRSFGSSALTISPGDELCYFSGHLVGRV